MRNNLSNTLERAKKKLIYEKHFTCPEQTSADFDNKIIEAYKDIMLLIPNLDKKGKQDEDWYLGEWLFDNRQCYTYVKTSKSKEDVARYISEVRKKNISEE